jgi:hypothetical protein
MYCFENGFRSPFTLLQDPVEISNWSVGKLVPYRRTCRKNDHAVQRMKDSINQFGFKLPILARSNGEIVDGHLRLKAATKLGIERVPAISRANEWPETQVKAFRLLVNRGPVSSSWPEPVTTKTRNWLTQAPPPAPLSNFPRVARMLPALPSLAPTLCMGFTLDGRGGGNVEKR